MGRVDVKARAGEDVEANDAQLYPYLKKGGVKKDSTDMDAVGQYNQLLKQINIESR